jgi:II/X family phage/plasmid replication protein
LAIEGSVHKAMLGHNVYGAPLPPVLTCYWFVDDVARRLGLPLPEAADWTVQRIDWAEAYELPSSAAVAEFVRGLNAAQYPRRKAMRYGSESLMFPGRTTAWKCYHKGPEFEAHDRKRLRECLDRGALDELQQRADRVLRLETSIKSQKLVADFGRKPTVLELTETYLEETHDRETDRVLREGAAEVETVRTLQEVLNRLDHTYGSSLGRSLFGTWSQLSTLGEEVTRQNMSRPTFYRHRKLLDQAGCSWHGTDVMLREHSLIPAGFSPIRRDPRRLVSMADEVSYKLGTYSRAA